jgi:hypothetical protein
VQRIAYSAHLRGEGPPPTGEPPTTDPRGSSVTIQSTTADGADAGIASLSYENHVVFRSESTFTETGTIALGNDGTLEIDTVGEGTLRPSGEPDLLHGAVIWRVTGGSGRFDRAHGLIASNFLLQPASGDVQEWQVGVVFVP